MQKFTKKMLIDHLSKSEKEDIVNEVLTLFDKFNNVKEYYKAELSASENPVLGTYKKKIADAYLLPNPKERSTNINLNKLITTFKKISIYRQDLIDLLLHRVECGITAFNRNKDRSETFYNCIFKSFQEAVDAIVEDGAMDEYKQRLLNIVALSVKGKYDIKDRMEKYLDL